MQVMLSAKRRTLSLILVVGLITGGFIAWRFARASSAEAPHLERFLPAGTIGFVQVRNLRAQTLQIADSEAWQELLRQNPTAGPLFLMGANHSGILDASYAVAWLGMEMRDGLQVPKGVLLVEFSSSHSRRTFEHRLWEHWKSASEPTKEAYDDFVIQSWSTPRGSLANIQSGNLVIISNSVKALKEVLDVRKGRAPSLASDARLIHARNSSGRNKDMFGFINGLSLKKLEESLPAGQESRSLHQLILGLGDHSFHYGSMISAFAEGRVTEFFTLYTPEGGTGLLRSFLNNPPTQELLLNLVPQDALEVFDASIANLPDTLDELKELINALPGHGGQPAVFGRFARLASEAGIDWQSLVRHAPGSEFCLARLTSRKGPLPVILINLLEEKSLVDAVAALERRHQLQVSTQLYQQVPMTSVSVEQPHTFWYAFLKGNLVLSPEAEGIEQVIDSTINGRTLSGSGEYAAARSRLVNKPLMIHYSSNRDYLNRLAVFLTRRGKDFKVSSPTLSLRPSFGAGYAKSDGFYYESRSPLGTFPKMLMGVTSYLVPEEVEPAHPHP
jgi:hypothetical protein